MEIVVVVRVLFVLLVWNRHRIINSMQEKEQLAEWLEELQMYKSLAPRELVSEKQKMIEP